MKTFLLILLVSFYYINAAKLDIEILKKASGVSKQLLNKVESSVDAADQLTCIEEVPGSATFHITKIPKTDQICQKNDPCVKLQRIVGTSLLGVSGCTSFINEYAQKANLHIDPQWKDTCGDQIFNIGGADFVVNVCFCIEDRCNGLPANANPDELPLPTFATNVPLEKTNPATSPTTSLPIITTTKGAATKSFFTTLTAISLIVCYLFNIN